MEGAVRALAVARLRRCLTLTHADRADLEQAGRVAVWEAAQRWDDDAANTATFETYAYECAKWAVQQESYRLAYPGASVGQVARYLGALGRNGGDHDAAERELTADGPTRRFSAATARMVRTAVEEGKGVELPDDVETPAHRSTTTHASDSDVSALLARFSPAESRLLREAASIPGGFTVDGRISVVKVAEATGKAQNTVKKTAQRVNRRMASVTRSSHP
jgi:hypothetical protein